MIGWDAPVVQWRKRPFPLASPSSFKRWFRKVTVASTNKASGHLEPVVISSQLYSSQPLAFLKPINTLNITSPLGIITVEYCN